LLYRIPNKAFFDKGLRTSNCPQLLNHSGQLVIDTISDFTAEFVLQKQSLYEKTHSIQRAQIDRP